MDAETRARPPAPSVRTCVLVVAAWLAVTAWRAFDERLVFSDSAVYAVLSQSLAEGRGYRRIDQAGAPRYGYYPFLYPAMLAPLRAAGVPLAGLCAVNIAWGAVFLWVFLRRFSGRVPAGLALAAALLAGMGALHEHALMIMSDVSAAALVLLGLAAAERWGASERLLCREGMLAAGCLLAAVWTRDAALAGLAAACSWIVLDAPRREGRWRKVLLLALVVGAGWAAWTACAGSQNLRVSLLSQKADPSRPMGTADWVLRLRNAALVNHPVFAARVLLPWHPDRPPPVFCFAFALLALAGWLAGLFGRRDPSDHLLPAVAIMLAVAECLNDRYLIPVAPILLVCAVRGLLLPAGRLPLLRTAAAAALWGLAAFGLLWHAAVPFGNRDYTGEMIAIARRAAPLLRPGECVLSDDTACLHQHAGIPGVSTFGGAEAAELAVASGRVRFIVVEANLRRNPRMACVVAPILGRHEGRLRERWRLGQTVYHEVLRPHE